MNELNIRNATLQPTTFNTDNRTVSAVPRALARASFSDSASISKLTVAFIVNV